MLVLNPSITTALSHLSGFTDSQWFKTALTKITPFLHETDTDLLLSGMVFLDLIDSDEQETILSQRSRYDRSDNIVSVVKRKGLAGYWRFYDCVFMDRDTLRNYSVLSYTEAREAHVNHADLRPTMAELTCTGKNPQYTKGSASAQV